MNSELQLGSHSSSWEPEMCVCPAWVTISSLCPGECQRRQLLTVYVTLWNRFHAETWSTHSVPKSKPPLRIIGSLNHALLLPNPARACNLLQERFSRHRLPSPLTRSRPGSRSTYKAEHLLYLLCQSDLILYQPLGLPEALNEFHVCSCRQYYAYLTDTQCKRVGTQCWVFGWVISYCGRFRTTWAFELPWFFLDPKLSAFQYNFPMKLAVVFIGLFIF